MHNIIKEPALTPYRSSLCSFRYDGAPLQPLLVHLGAPGHHGCSGWAGAAQLLGTQRQRSGPRGVEEGRHVHDAGLGRAAEGAGGRLAAHFSGGAFQAQQAR